LEVLDRPDRRVGAHDVLDGVIAGDAVLVEIGDDADVRHPGVLDGEAEGREGEGGDVDLAGGQRGDLRRAAAKADRLEGVGFAVMPEDALVLEEDRRELRRHDGPAGAYLERFGTGGER